MYLPRVKDSDVLLTAIREGVALVTWESDGFAYADGYDEKAERYQALRAGQQLPSVDANGPGLLVKPAVARRQLDEETAPAKGGTGVEHTPTTGADEPGAGGREEAKGPKPLRRFHGTVRLDPARVGRDASRIAEEVVAHLAGLVGANVTVTLEIEADIPTGAPDHVVRTVTENSRTLKFTSQGFERE